MKHIEDFQPTSAGRGQIACWVCHHVGGTLQRVGIYPDGSPRYQHPKGACAPTYAWRPGAA